MRIEPKRLSYRYSIDVVTFSTLSRMSDVYPSMGPSLSSGFVSSFDPPMIGLLRVVHRSITPGSLDDIHGRIVGLFAPVLRSTEGYQGDLLAKAAPY